MKKLALALCLPLLCAAESTPQARIERAVERELVMVPQYGVFDHLAYQVDGRNVTLTGSVTRPVTKLNAERNVKSIEAVEKVDNKITVLPIYAADDAIRLAVYRAIYGSPSLERYALQAVPSIHIIVTNALEGAVGTKADAEIAAISANSVSGVFSVTSHLKVDAPAKE